MLNPNKKVLFIYNPASGKGQVPKHLDYVVSELNKKFGSVNVIKSESLEHLKSTIHDASYEYDYIFFSGGDGTFNNVLNSIPEDALDLPIFGYLPGGSTCDMSYNLNISKNVKKGIIDLMNSKVKEYNIGSFGDKRFIYVADFGMFIDAVHLTPPEHKKKFGKLAYAFYGIKSLFTTVKSHRVVVDGVIYKTPLMIISNSKEVASFKINPNKKQDDGIYYIAIVKDGFLHGLFNVTYLFAFGLELAVKNNKVVSFESSRFQLDCDVNDWDMDGEEVTMTFPVVCGYSGKKIKVLTNRD